VAHTAASDNQPSAVDHGFVTAPHTHGTDLFGRGHRCEPITRHLKRCMPGREVLLLSLLLEGTVMSHRSLASVPGSSRAAGAESPFPAVSLCVVVCMNAAQQQCITAAGQRQHKHLVQHVVLLWWYSVCVSNRRLQVQQSTAQRGLMRLQVQQSTAERGLMRLQVQQSTAERGLMPPAK